MFKQKVHTFNTYFFNNIHNAKPNVTVVYYTYMDNYNYNLCTKIKCNNIFSNIYNIKSNMTVLL